MNYDASQLAAMDAAVAPGDRIITGGAGTGKTTLVKTILDRLGARAELLAPTGKAAARLREATSYHAATIHSWLKWDGVKCNRTAQARLPLIIDEVSMVDSWMLAQVLRFQPPKIVLVGDAAQLSPVGKGAPFHDLLRLRPEIVSTLTTCHRATAAVHHAAAQIRDGHMPAARSESGGERYTQTETGDGAATEDWLREMLEKIAYDPELDIILACHNGTAADDNETGRDPGTVASLNRLLIQLYNPREANELWRVGDRVMNTKNYSGDDWWNGDTGTVASVDMEGNLYVAVDRPRSQGAEILLDRDLRRRLVHAYALTVHKSQGSQYRRVIFVATKRATRLLDRSLIYTAVTRAREEVIVCGESSAFRAGLRRCFQKRTVLQRLAEDAGAMVAAAEEVVV